MITEEMLKEIAAVSEQNAANRQNVEFFEFDMNSYGLSDLVDTFRYDGTLLERATEWVENKWMKTYVEKAYINGMNFDSSFQ